MTYHYPVCLLAWLPACLTACWLGSENGEWRRFFIEKQKGPVGGKGPMRERPIMLWEGTERGDPPPPSPLLR